MRKVWVPLLVGTRGAVRQGSCPLRSLPGFSKLPFPIPTPPHLKLGPVHGHAGAAGAAEPPEVILGICPPDGLLQLPVHVDIAVCGGDGELGGGRDAPWPLLVLAEGQREPIQRTRMLAGPPS